MPEGVPERMMMEGWGTLNPNSQQSHQATGITSWSCIFYIIMYCELLWCGDLDCFIRKDILNVK